MRNWWNAQDKGSKFALWFCLFAVLYIFAQVIRSVYFIN